MTATFTDAPSEAYFFTMPKAPDPTKDAKFQDVVQHFLKTPPKPFTPKAKLSRPKKTSDAKPSSPKRGGKKA
jgi:hypothetical protein